MLPLSMHEDRYPEEEIICTRSRVFPSIAMLALGTAIGVAVAFAFDAWENRRRAQNQIQGK